MTTRQLTIADIERYAANANRMSGITYWQVTKPTRTL